VASAILVSSLTAAELSYGVDRRRSKKLRKLLSAFLEVVAVLPFDAAAASRCGRVAASSLPAGARSASLPP